MGIAISTAAGDYMVMQNQFIFSLIYVWARNVPDQQMSIWGFPVQSKNLPWVLMAFHLFTGGNPFNDLIGVATGHMYYYLKAILPESHGYDLLKTPSVADKLVLWLKGLGQDPRQNPRNARNMHFVNNTDGVANPGNRDAGGNQNGVPLNRNAPRN